MRAPQVWREHPAYLLLVLAVFGGFLYAYFEPNFGSGLISPPFFGAQKKLESPPFSSAVNKGKADLAVVTPKFGRILGTTAPSATTPPSATTIPTDASTAKVETKPNPASAKTTASNSDQPPGNNSSPQRAVTEVGQVILSYLRTSNFEALYNLMSLDFKNTFSHEDFLNSFAGSTKVLDGTFQGEPKISGPSSDWAEQSLKLNLADGTNQTYLNIYHWENGAWTLFGTDEK